MVKSNYKYISGKDFIKKLDKVFGVEVMGQRGSHIKIKSNGNKTIIPNHKVIAYGTFSSILKQLEIDEEDFLKKI